MSSAAVVLTLVHLTLTGTVQEEVDARHFVRIDPWARESDSNREIVDKVRF